jgi:hypothetical protein
VPMLEFVDLTQEEQQAVCTDAEEWYLSYIFLQQIGKQHATLETDLQNDFTIGNN